MLKPRLLSSYLLATLPPPGTDMSAQWRNLAVDSMALLADGEVSAELVCAPPIACSRT